jgi:KDO2-lipid IV(A) lauroyltransferase
MIEKCLNIFQNMSADSTHRTAKAAGALWYALDRRHRELAKSNIRLALGVSHSQADRVAMENFVHLSRVFLETPQVARIQPSNFGKFVSTEGIKHLESSLELGRGVLILTGHFGNWEWMAHCCPFIFSARLNIVARPLNPPWLDGAVRSLRERSGNRVINKKNAATPILKALSRNEIVGILLDQNAGSETGIYAPFFGGYVPTHRGMALMAVKSGAPVHPVFNWRDSSGKYHVEIQPALVLPADGPLPERLFKATALFNACLEKQIRRFPGQWYWIHRRFRHYIREPAR